MITILHRGGSGQMTNLGPPGPQNGPKTAQISQNGDLKALVVPNGWNSVERRWNGLWEVQVEDFEPIWRSWVPPNLAQGPPKMAQIGPNCPKWRFEGSGGPKRLEQRGTKLERALGGPSQSFWTNLEERGAPKFGPAAPKNGPNWPKLPKMAF